MQAEKEKNNPSFFAIDAVMAYSERRYRALFAAFVAYTIAVVCALALSRK